MNEAIAGCLSYEPDPPQRRVAEVAESWARWQEENLTPIMDAVRESLSDTSHITATSEQFPHFLGT